MRKFLFPLCLLILTFMAMPSYAAVKNYVPNAQKVGEIRFSFVFWDIYDATLYAPKGQWSFDKPFYLKLSYLMDIDAIDIIKQTERKIRKQGFNDEAMIRKWSGQLEQIFPNVQNGTVLYGIYDGNGSTLFYEGNKKIGQINDEVFSQLFFNIWLGKNSSFPHLTRKLLGQSL